jgi:hypothetical protein
MSEYITCILYGSDLDVAHILTEFAPLSKLMAKQMTGLRNWVKGARAVSFRRF